MAETEAEFSKLHILMFPWLAIGHMTPFLHISNELAARGHQITFLLPKSAFPKLQSLNLHPHLISFQILTVPHVCGLPPGSETASEVPPSLEHLLAIAMDLTRPQVEEIIRCAAPDFVFYDFAHWLPEITGPLGIKSICYITICAATVAITPDRTVTLDSPLTEEEVREPPPGYPSTTVVFRGGEIKSVLFMSMPFGDGITFHGRMTAAFRSSDAVAVRTCEEIEGIFCDYLAKKFEKKILLTGPVLPAPEKTTSSNNKWVKWLDGFQPNTVIFCALGSQLVLEEDQFHELLLALEKTGSPFLAALKPPAGFASVDDALPEGFAERVKTRGIVNGNWVPQPLILNHPSVGCFVSHCGCGSMWESLLSECQIVAVPHFGDQILNSKLLVEELKVAAAVKREDDGRFTKESVREAIELVMDGGEFAEMVKKNHGKWREVLTKPGFMEGYIEKFVRGLQQWRGKGLV